MAYFDFVTIILALALVENVAGLCMPEHPQAAVCRAQYVIRAKIIAIKERKHPWEKEQDSGMKAKPTPLISGGGSRPVPLIGGGGGLAPAPLIGGGGLAPAPLIGGGGPAPAPLIGGGGLAPAPLIGGGGPAPAPLIGGALASGYGFPKPRVIKVVLSRVYKGFKFINASRGSRLDIEYASPYELLLKPGSFYLLTGFSADGKLYTSLCNWNSKWEDLTISQKHGLKFYYWMYCACKIQFCPDGNCKRSRRFCTWDLPSFHIGAARSDCYSKYNICVVDPGLGRCAWYSPKSKKCQQPKKQVLP